MKNMIKFKLIAALIAVMLLLIFANAKGQGVKISALPTLSAPDSSADYIPIVHSGTTYKVTPGKLFHEFGASGGGGGSLPLGEIGVGTGSGIGSTSDFTWDNSVRTLFSDATLFITTGVMGIAFDESNSIITIGDPNSDLNNCNLIVDNNLNRYVFNYPNLNINSLGYTFPSSFSSAGSVLVDVDGAGTLAWAGIGGAAGSDGEIQFNDGDAFAASPSFVWDDANQVFTVNGSVNSTSLFVDDANESIGLSANETILMTGGNYIQLTGNSLSFLTLNSSGSAQIGGITGYYTAQNASHEWRVKDYASGVGFRTFNMYSNVSASGISLGDIDNAHGGDLITLGLHATGVSIKSLSGTGTRMVVANSTGGISTQAIPSGTGTVTSIATTSPITGGTITTTGTIGIDNAAADGTTKGAASFTAADFNSSSGLISLDYTNAQKTAADGSTLGFATFTAADFNSSTGLISIDYTNGQAATSGQKGFLTSADWSTFNGKQAAGSYLTADGAVTGAGSQAQVFTSGIETGLIDDNDAGEILVLLGGIDKLGVYTSGVQTVAGSAASPSYSFFTDPTSGLYLKTVESEIGASVDGALVGGFNTAGLFANSISELSAANGVLIDGVQLKDGLIAGQYGGTGVANTGKTITLGGNLTTSGAHATTFTTTGTTNLTLPTTGTLPTLDGTETFTNKSIVATQLTGTAYTFGANNTNSTAAYTLQRYEDHDLATYSGTVDFNGTDPASITSQQYAWSRIGNTVTLFFSIFYGTPGVTNTSAIITMPSDCPAPATFATGGDAASEYIFPINGGRVEANMTGNPSAIRGGLRRNATNDGYEVALIFGSVSAAHCSFTISYRTQ